MMRRRGRKEERRRRNEGRREGRKEEGKRGGKVRRSAHIHSLNSFTLSFIHSFVHSFTYASGSVPDMWFAAKSKLTILVILGQAGSVQMRLLLLRERVSIFVIVFRAFGRQPTK